MGSLIGDGVPSSGTHVLFSEGVWVPARVPSPLTDVGLGDLLRLHLRWLDFGLWRHVRVRWNLGHVWFATLTCFSKVW
uniref:Uncharacterized protein n=1 Tax=Arundo donax TaxID=35708 RepID=A0A0A8ZI13_ARUDO